MKRREAERIAAKVTKLGFKTFVRESDYGARGYYICYVSAEEGDDAAHYYGEFGTGPWINPKLEAFAKAEGGYWEWRDPSAIGFCD